MNHIITGLMMKATSFKDIEMMVMQMRNIVEGIANNQFRVLVQKETERLFDAIVLHETEIPDDISIYAAASQNVVRKTIIAEQRGDNIEYNLSIGIQLFAGMTKENEPCTYIRVFAPNDIYTDQIVKRMKDVYPFHVDVMDENQSDPKNENQKSKIWNKIMEDYKTDIPINVGLYSRQNLKLLPEELKFRSPMHRAADIAQERVMNYLLSMYSGGEQIQPNKLMEYMVKVISRLTNASVIKLQEQWQNELCHILPAITTQMITSTGQERIPAKDTGEQEKRNIKRNKEEASDILKE